MDGKQKLQSLIERRRKKQSKQQKDGEHLNKIAEARNEFLHQQNITPDVYNEHDVYMQVIQKRFYELCKWPQLTLREFVNVNILNGHSPKELYLVRKMDEDKVNEFQRTLTTEYENTQYPLVYCMKAGLICVAKSSKGWQRCRILKLHENSTDALLFDIGIIERINWHDLRIINEKFANIKPMAVRCSLINIITAQPLERFSIQHHQRFHQILKEQNDFYIFVNRANFMSSDIYLYYKSENNEFHCVNNIFPAQTISDDSSFEDDATSEAFAANTSSSANSRLKSKSKVELEPVQHAECVIDLNRMERGSLEAERGSLETKRSSFEIASGSFESEQSNESPPQPPPQKPLSIVSPPETVEQRPESLGQLIDTCKISRAWNVKIKQVIDIDEIYVCFSKYEDALNRLRFDVQSYVEAEEPTAKDAWEIGDYCLAVDPAEGSGEWLRGKIVNKPTSDSCMVYLRDIGKTIKCKGSDLKEINRELQIVRDCAWKMKLASVKRVQHITASMMQDLINDKIETFEEIAMSIISDDNGNDKGIILWGIKKIFNALLPEKIEYVNINQSLVDLGVARASASFHGITSMINPAHDHYVDEKPHSIDDDRDIIEHMHFSSCNQHTLPLLKMQKYEMVTDKRGEVKSWLPAERIAENQFVAFPMYVSQRLIIYALEESRKTVSDEIKEILEKMYRNKQLERKDSILWKKEDACFALYDLDNRFYRATIRRVNFAKNTCVVRFIDFGNCETCSLDDLRKATMFGDIPVLTRQYQLPYIQPTTSDGLWPEHVRNFCSDLIVERHCDLVIIDGPNGAEAASEVENCRLDLLTRDRDLATALITRGYAKPAHPVNGVNYSKTK